MVPGAKAPKKAPGKVLPFAKKGAKPAAKGAKALPFAKKSAAKGKPVVGSPAAKPTPFTEGKPGVNPFAKA